MHTEMYGLLPPTVVSSLREFPTYHTRVLLDTEMQLLSSPDNSKIILKLIDITHRSQTPAEYLKHICQCIQRYTEQFRTSANGF